MSQVYIKKCNRCGNYSELPNVAAPPGWQCLADMMHGTLASIDICPSCQDDMGLRVLLNKAVQDRAVGALKQMIVTDPELMPPALNAEEIEARIRAGEFDAAFQQGDGVDLEALAAEDQIEEAELVE